LTDSNVDIVEFNKSYFSLNLDIQLNFEPNIPVLPPKRKEWMTTLNPPLNLIANEGTSWADDPVCANLAKMTDFIEFKNSTDCIGNYRITHNNLNIGETRTSTAQLESFLFNSMKPICEKENKRNALSLWEEVHKHNPSICGKCFTL
jgi:hypothetical protein